MPTPHARTSLALLALPILGALVAGCSTSSGLPPNDPLIVEDKPRPVDPPSKEDAAVFASSSNALGGDLYAEVAGSSGNFTMSPASISMALAMTWMGARGVTRDEMTKVLHLDGDAAAITHSAGQLLSTFNDPNQKEFKLSVVNRLFGEKTYPFAPAFLTQTRDEFGAALAPVDFLTAWEPARVQINGFVEKQTNDKIKDLLPDGSIGATTRLVLVNAIYFHADWAHPFTKQATYKAPFTAHGQTKDVATMHETMHVDYAAVDGVKVLDLGYVGADISMTFLLPDDPSKLHDLESKLSKGGFEGLASKLEQKKVQIALPKFKVEPSGSLSLVKPLAKLGMVSAFDDSLADFSGMGQAGANPLFISEVVHKAFVAVDEEGTEAAAATAVVMNLASATAPTEQEEFNADHPFLFVLRDKKSGMILFIGRVEDPAA